MRTKTGKRDLNPADAQRKAERKKEVQRNKLERKFMREAATQREKPEDIKKQLQEVLTVEESGKVLNKQLRLRKKVLQEAYDHALKKKKEDETRKRSGDSAPSVGLRAEDSRYYHPTLNPTGAPPPGKAAAGVITAPQGSIAAGASAALSLPVPKKPPLPAGPAPSRALPPPPTAPPLPPGPAPHQAAGAPLPPPAGPPPQGPHLVLPPPAGPPPGIMLPPPALPPPGAPPPGMMFMHPPPGAPLPPPMGPPPVLPPPMGPPPVLPPPSGPPPVLPPPLGPPPILPPPSMPYPMAMRPPGMPFPPPAGPPPVLPPPSMPPPAASSAAAATATASAAASTSAAAAAGARKDAIITGTSTVIKRPMAQNDKMLTSMVPASVRIRRDEAKPRAKPAGHKGIEVGPGFGLAPVSRPATLAAASGPPAATLGSGSGAGAPPSTDSKYLEFMQTMSELGAFVE